MNLLQNARLLLVSSLYTTLLLSGCGGEDTPNQHTMKPSPGEGEKPAVSSGPACSTLNGATTDNCTIEGDADDAQTIHYTLVSSRETVNIPAENGKSSITMHDAMVYNKSLLPERIELRRGDELRINYRNELSLPPPEEDKRNRFKDVGSNVEGMQQWFSNLHTHGLVTPWDFKDSADERGDNVLGILLDSKRQGLPAGIDPKDICSTSGDHVSYRYPISADHEIGLNWYHPHPHGVTGFQVEGGMSGLLMIGDAQAEKLLNTTYLQLKDMQASKRTDDSYQFEKFQPPVAGVCYSKETDEGWAFDSDAPGRCNYHKESPGENEPTDYSWLFLVNGELFPTIELPEAAYLRIANSSSNATYRLMLTPEAVRDQAVDTTVSYFTPPFKVVEKDGMTTTEIARTDTLDSCTVAMTPATRVGVELDFADMARTGSVCELKVIKRKGENGKTEIFYDVQHKTLDDEGKKSLAKQDKPDAYTLMQEGIDTGEDDWPTVQLATLKPTSKLPQGNLAAYQQMLAEHNKQLKVAARTDVKPPDDSCSPDLPPADADGINRHVALFYGSTTDATTGESAEHFGLIAAGETYMDKTVTADTIADWRKKYQAQFVSLSETGTTYGPNGEQITLQGYGAPDLQKDDLLELADHKFHINKDGSIKANICTRTSNRTERWRIHNLSAQIHNFHIHQMKFHVANVRGATCVLPTADAEPQAIKLADPATGYLKSGVTTEMLAGAMDEQCVKSYAELFHNVPASFKLVEAPPLPPGLESIGEAAAPPTMMTQAKQDYGMHDTFPVPPMGYIDIELNLNKPEHVGEYVFHCHILEHEDAGMMGKLVVQPGSNI